MQRMKRSLQYDFDKKTNNIMQLIASSGIIANNKKDTLEELVGMPLPLTNDIDYCKLNEDIVDPDKRDQFVSIFQLFTYIHK